jgi:hypothetical protein
MLIDPMSRQRQKGESLPPPICTRVLVVGKQTLARADWRGPHGRGSYPPKWSTTTKTVQVPASRGLNLAPFSPAVGSSFILSNPLRAQLCATGERPLERIRGPNRVGSFEISPNCSLFSPPRITSRLQRLTRAGPKLSVRLGEGVRSQRSPLVTCAQHTTSPFPPFGAPPGRSTPGVSMEGAQVFPPLLTCPNGICATVDV